MAVKRNEGLYKGICERMDDEGINEETKVRVDEQRVTQPKDHPTVLDTPTVTNDHSVDAQKKYERLFVLSAN